MLVLCLLLVLAPTNSQYLNISDKAESILTNPCTDKNHIVLAPGVLKAGGINRACVSRFHPDGPARLMLTLLTKDLQTTTASRELPPGDGGCLDISAPLLPNTKAELIVKLQYPEAQCSWERRLTLRISSGRVLIAQTERARYRPGDVVRARLLALKPDLAPSHGSIEEVWLEGPQGAWEGTRVAQWLHVRTRLGLAQIQYQLDTLAPPGKWTLRAKLEDGSQGSAVFWVGHYELPPFQLSVRHAPRVLRTSERLVWTVCVRYPWSEAVEGMLVIRLRGAGAGGGNSGVRTAVRLRAPKPCHRHAVAAKRVGLHSQNPPEVLVADFSFQEEGTRIWQNTTVVSQVVDKPITLEFLTKHRAVISRGLPYKLKVKATRWDDKPAPNELIRVCRHPTAGPAELAESPETSHPLCADGQTDGSGVARLMFAAVQDEAPFYKFQAQLKNDSTSTASLTVRVRSGAVQAALGPLKADSRSSRTLVPLYINTHVTTPLTVHFVVITRGGIIYRWGATTQCPTSNSADQIHTASRNYKCNDNYYAYNHDVMAQTDKVPNTDNIDAIPHRYKRSSDEILTTENDPNTVGIDTTINPQEKSGEDVKTDSNIVKDKSEENKTKVKSKSDENKTDDNASYLEVEIKAKTAVTSGNALNLNITSQVTDKPNETPKSEVTQKPNETPKSAENLINKIENKSKVTEADEETTAGKSKQINVVSTQTTIDVKDDYNRPILKPSPISLTADQSNKYHIILRDSKINLQNLNVPTVTQKVTTTGTSERHSTSYQDLTPNSKKYPKDQIVPRVTNSYSHILQQYMNMPKSTFSEDLNLRHFKTYSEIVPSSTQRFTTTFNPEQYTNIQKGNDDVDNNVTIVTSDSLLERKLKVMLPIKVSHQMCPDSHLIAYFYYNGELVSAAKHFEMDECFANKAEATWLNRQAQPGSLVSLQVSSPGPALCALTALDTATKWVQPPPTTRELLMNNLKRLIDSHRNLTEYDAAGECFLNTDTPEMPTTSMELTSSWLASAGVRILGGEAPRAALKRCETPPPAALVTNEPAPRTDFSEAWLWRVLPLSANGTGVASARAPDSITRFEAGVTCVSKNGVAVSPPAVLQVFREFFIHADGPKRLRRGDSAIIRYRIFNYLYEPLSVQIQILTDPHIEAVTDGQTQTACIAARSSIARRVSITARVASPARLSLRAKTTTDGNCPNVTTSTTASDEVILKMIIDPEGVPVQDQKSILLCGNDIDEREYNYFGAQLGSSQIEWTWPRVQAVPGTETLTLWIVGDMTGPLLADADSLVTIPRGCGEQNMAQLATNLLALRLLEPSSIAALVAREHVARGFTRQLQYVHPSGGFSAFGPSDVTSSTWLTAFAVKHLRKAHQLLWPNLQTPPALIRAERWLLNQQMENGCFRNEGQVFHRELRGGLNEEGEIASVALSAYVITSLIDSTIPISYRVLRNTLSCLRALPPLKSQTPTRVYAHALLAYAYMKVEKYEEDLRKTNKANLARNNELEKDDGVRQVLELLKVARRSGGYVWWEASSLSTSIEATSYALLALRASPRAVHERGGVSDAAGALRWLASHRTAGGGFVSTQDTLVALEALTAWSSSTPSTHLNVTAKSGDRAQTLTLLPGARIPDVISLILGERLDVNVQGRGCALVQATRSYHTVAAQKSETEKLLSVQVAVHTEGPFDCDHNQTVCFCAAIIEACVVWSGRFPEMALLEVTLPGGFGADAQLLYSQLHKPSSLLRRIELTPTNSRATFYLGSRDGSEPARAGAHECFAVHAVGPRAHTRPAHARVQDYYAPAHNHTQLFTIPEDCPPRITHDVPQYTSSDNLFAKARSFEGDEILISNEFTYEDMPEGIPLEDPLYDNLTKKERSEEIEKYLENATITSDEVFEKTTSATNLGNVNLNPNGHQSHRNGNLDTFTLNNVEETHVDAPNTPHVGELRHHDSNPRSNQAIINRESNIRSFDNVEDSPTTKTVLSEKLSQPTNDKLIDISAQLQNSKDLDNTNKPIDNPNLAQAQNNKPIDSLNLPQFHNHNPMENPNFGQFLNNKPIDKTNLADFHINMPVNNPTIAQIHNNKPIDNPNLADFHINMPVSNPNLAQFHNNKPIDNPNLSEFHINMPVNNPNLAQFHNTKPIDKPNLAEFHNIMPVKNPNLAQFYNNKPVDNPNLSEFHIIDTERDLDVPIGIEGPIPAIVLPPKDFVPPPQDMGKRLRTVHTSRGSYLFFEPELVSRRYFVPRTGHSVDLNHFKIRRNIR